MISKKPLVYNEPWDTTRNIIFDASQIYVKVILNVYNKTTNIRLDSDIWSMILLELRDKYGGPAS